MGGVCERRKTHAPHARSVKRAAAGKTHTQNQVRARAGVFCSTVVCSETDIRCGNYAPTRRRCESAAHTHTHTHTHSQSVQSKRGSYPSVRVDRPSKLSVHLPRSRFCHRLLAHLPICMRPTRTLSHHRMHIALQCVIYF
jgi:hypothetical protein